MKDSLPRAVACVCLCGDEGFPPTPVLIFLANTAGARLKV